MTNCRKGVIMAEKRILKLADESTIVQSHQKDTYIESILTSKLREVLTGLKGQYFTNMYPQEILISGKIIYLALTTLRGKRTLGEEYVDLIYVNRKNNGIVKKYQRLLFIVSYTIVPYLLSRVATHFSKLLASEDADRRPGILASFLQKGSLKNVLNVITDLHLVLFYFKGGYYQISKRLFGLKYAIAHDVGEEEEKFKQSSSSSYKILGSILLLQLASKSLPFLSSLLVDYKRPLNHGVDGNTGNDELTSEISGVPILSELDAIDLDNPEVLPFIPQESRKCILCLTNMSSPSCCPCGHLFCWSCIFNWCKERPECPLCRQKCLKQSILPIK